MAVQRRAEAEAARAREAARVDELMLAQARAALDHDPDGGGGVAQATARRIEPLARGARDRRRRADAAAWPAASCGSRRRAHRRGLLARRDAARQRGARSHGAPVDMPAAASRVLSGARGEVVRVLFAPDGRVRSRRIADGDDARLGIRERRAGARSPIIAAASRIWPSPATVSCSPRRDATARPDCGMPRPARRADALPGESLRRGAWRLPPTEKASPCATPTGIALWDVAAARRRLLAGGKEYGGPGDVAFSGDGKMDRRRWRRRASALGTRSPPRRSVRSTAPARRRSWRSRPTVCAWRARAKTARCACGRSPAARAWRRPIAVMRRATCASPPTVNASRRRAARSCACGRWRRIRARCASCAATSSTRCAWHFRPTAASSPRQPRSDGARMDARRR